MKKALIILMSLCLVFVLCACSGGKESIKRTDDTIEDCESPDSFNEQIGVPMTVPDTARNVKCVIINSVIAETQFAYNGIVYTCRGSKIYSGENLHGVSEPLTGKTEIEIDERAAVEAYNAGISRVATWYRDGNCYSLVCDKNVSNDTLTELLDLIV